MMVLFLGGPWHNQRHEVTPGRMASAERSLPLDYKVPVVAEDDGDTDPAPDQPATARRVPRPRGYVTYTRRFARARGERFPVYVSPEYQGPARA